MNIILLGGAGDMGSKAVEELARTNGVTRVTIADRNVAAAERVAASLSGAPASVDVRSVDADDHAGLVQAMAGYDLAASALGPYYRFETKIVRAALEARVDYASICDDWSATQAVLDQFDGPARQAGRTVLIGLGTSPGISNVGVRYFAQQMDQIRRVDVGVYQPLDAGGGEAVIHHMLYVISGQIAVWREGKQVMIPACSERRTIEFPQFGPVAVWAMGHGEPVSVPRFVPGVEEVNFFMGFGKGSGLFVEPGRLGLFKSRRLSNAAVRLVLWAERRSGAKAPAPGAVRIDVWGTKDGQAIHRFACGVGTMRAATGISLAVGALMLGRKELLVTGGAITPEACIDPAAFLAEMRARGVTAYQDLAMTQAL